MPKRKHGITGNAQRKRRAEQQQQRRLLIKKGLPVDFWKQHGTLEFNFEWMKYYEWVVPVKDNIYEVHCTWCNLNLDIRSTGHKTLFAHEKSQTHRNILNQNTIDDDDDSSLKAVSPSNPQAPPVVRIADKSPNLLVTSRVLSSRYQTNLSNCNFIIYKGSPSKRLDNVRNTREFDGGSRLDLPQSNGFSENNSKLTQSDTRKNSSPQLLDSITSRAADAPSNGGQSVFLAHNHDNVAVASVSAESSQTGTTMERSSRYPFIPSSSVAVEQELQNAEMIFEIDSSYPSVPSPPRAMEQTPQNAEMMFEIESNSYTTLAAMEIHRNVEMALKKGIDYPSTSAVSTATSPTERNNEKCIDYPSTSGFSTASPELSQIGTTIQKSSRYSSIPSSSVAVEQELQNDKKTFEIDSIYPSVPSPPTAMEQTPQNAEVMFEIHSNSCTTPASMEEILRNVEMAHKKGIDYPSTSGFSTASPEPSQIGTAMEKSSSYPSIPSSSVAVKQELQNVEMTFEIDSSNLSVRSPPTAVEQTPQNAGVIFEIDSSACTTPAAMEETHRNVEMSLEKGIDYPSTSTVSTATVPTERNTEKGIDYPTTSGFSTAFPEPSQIGTTIQKSSRYSSIPSSSVAVKQEIQNDEMTFEIDSSYPSVPSPPTAMGQTPQNAEVMFEIYSNSCTTPASMEETLRNVGMTLKKGIDYPSTSGFSTVSPDPSQIGTTMEISSSYPSIPSSSVAVEQELQNVEMTFEIDSSYLSVPSPPTPIEQTPQNAGMIFEIDSSACTTPAAMEETHRNVAMALDKGIEYPSTSAISTAVVPTERNTELPLEISGIHPSSHGPFAGPNKKHIIVSLDRYSEPSSRKHEVHFPHSNNYHMFRRLSAACESESAQHCSKDLQTAQRVHSLIRDKTCLKNEVCSIFERLDEAKCVDENKCRIIMEDYKILLNKFSQVSDPTFLPSEFLMPEYASSWNSLKLIKILLSEENIFGNEFSHNSREVRKRGRQRKDKI